MALKKKENENEKKATKKSQVYKKK
jgi:hypothetical protein